MNKKNLIIQIYAYLVAFSSVICLSITLGVAVYSMIGIISPETTLNQYKWEQISSFERFKKSKEGCYSESKKTLPDDITLQKMYEEEKILTILGERRESVQTLIYTAIITAISVILFILHWKLGKRLRKEES